MTNNKANILIVEDSPGERRLIEDLFEELGDGNKLHIVKNGLEAMEFLEKKGEFQERPRPDLVILDLDLPMLSGDKLLKAIKTSEEWKTIPVIVFSSSAEEEDILKSYANNANGYVTKPDSVEDYYKVLRSIKEFWLETTKLPPKTLP